MAASNYWSIILCLLLFCMYITFTGAYLASKPENLVVARGSAAKFTCQTSLSDPVDWLFTVVNCSRHETCRKPWNAEHVTNRRVERSTSPNHQYRYTLVLDGVASADSGTYTCVDDNGRGEAAFAELTVLDSPSDISLPVCPSDTVVRAGDNVILRAATLPGNEIRWYRSTDSSQVQRVVYSGLEMDYNSLDERFDVIKTRPGQVDLVIQRVRLEDAGVYRARDERTQKEASANVVVIDPATPVPLCRNESGMWIKCTCTVKFHGRLSPTMRWLNFQGQTINAESQDVVKSGDGFSSSIKLPANDRSTRPNRCQAEFRLTRCNEYFATFYWTSEPVQLPLSGTALSDWFEAPHQRCGDSVDGNWLKVYDGFDCQTLLLLAAAFTSLLLAVIVILSVATYKTVYHPGANKAEDREKITSTLVVASAVPYERL